MKGSGRALGAHADLEIELLLEAIFRAYHYDFRGYAKASLTRRLVQATEHLGCATLSGVQEKVLHDPRAFSALLPYLTVPVSDMFRDPIYYRALREHVVPVLRTYPSLKLWVAGCSTGEEAYSLAILLREEALLDRAIIYATDINPVSLEKARAGVYALDRFRHFTENHRLSGGVGSLSDHYHAAHGSAVLDKALKQRIVFSDHSLTTDSVFAEVQLISCRNVLIYFDRPLKDRVVRLFHASLCRKGFLGLGIKETTRDPDFVELCREGHIFARRT